jgi:hypothetical protein
MKRHLLFSAESRSLMTIFGYNTDVQHDGTVYHVQSEARQNDLLLQTIVYVKGQCVGKQAFSYAAQTLLPDFSEEAIHELLKIQHKHTVDAIQQGQIQAALSLHNEISDAGREGLVLNWTNSRDVVQNGKLKMHFQVLEKGQPAGGAEIMLLVGDRSSGQALIRGEADSAGQAELQVEVAGLAEPAVIAQANRGGKSATRKFRFRQ